MSKQATNATSEPLGVISFNYCQVQLPLAKAHIIQSILAGLDVAEVETIYGNNQTASVSKRLTVPNVRAERADVAYDYDALMLDDEQYLDWKKLVTTAKADEGFDLKECLPPANWLALKGESK